MPWKSLMSSNPNLLWGDSNEAVLVNVAGRFTARDVAALLENEDFLHGDLNVDFDI